MAHAFYMLTALLLLALPAQAQDGDESEESAVRVRDAAQLSLAQHFPEAANRLEVRVKRISGEAESLPQPRIQWPATDRLPRGHAQVKVLAPSGKKAGWALLHVAHYDSVLVAAQTLSDEVPLTARDVNTSWIETTRFRGTPLRAADFRRMLRQGQVLTDRRLSAGRTLRKGDVHPPYATQTGEKVQMLYDRQGFAMQLDCKAREPGHMGEVVRLYSPTTKSTYRARLLADGRAKWVETL